MNSENDEKRIKKSNLLDKYQNLAKTGVFSTCKTTSDGHGTFYSNPEKIERLLKQGNCLRIKGESIRTVDALKIVIKSFMCYLRVHVLCKGQTKGHFKQLKQVHKMAIYFSEKFNKKHVKDILLYAIYTIYQDILYNHASQVYKSQNTSDLQIVLGNVINIVNLNKLIRNKEFKIVSLDRLEDEISTMLPEYFKKE